MTTSLSDKAIQNLTDALIEDAVQYVQSSEDYADFMVQMFLTFLREKLGEMDAILASELAVLLLDNTSLSLKKCTPN